MRNKKKKEELEKLWEEFVKLKPANSELIGTMVFVAGLREKAWNRLLLQKPSSTDFCRIIAHVPDDSCKERAARLLIDYYNPSEDDLRCIFRHVRSMHKEVLELMKLQESRKEVFNKMVRLF